VEFILIKILLLNELVSFIKCISAHSIDDFFKILTVRMKPAIFLKMREGKPKY
jgi:hypothetical protein